MPCKEEDPGLPTAQGKHLGIFICWLLGNGCLFGFNSGTATFAGVCTIAAVFGIAEVLFASISCFFELLCVVIYTFVFPKLPIVKFYHYKAASEGSMTVNADLAAGGIQGNSNPSAEEGPVFHERLSSKQVLLQNVDYAFDMFLIYTLSLSIFPGFLAEDTGSHNLGSWYVLVLITSFSAWDLVGRYLPLINRIKLTSRKGLLAVICSRFLFVPAFYYTVKYSDQGWVIMLTWFLGLSNGYFTVCVLTEAPKGYKGLEQNALGNLLVLSLLVGLKFGDVLDWLWLIGKGW
ncbi:Equilibrative nucleotide transporter 3 [Dichanthelium oligosanthes]|uniref:Equilibrative nucleotide transporter 3 n=1 Tax=Dichanthelium oligosanthes TaxID=888268 RepID=A0A1E5W989_9POAL|nr:Equilibrative nucleotide transporter 3 [Dichanthelium oligosanthes]